MAPQANSLEQQSILALDVGTKRIGVALASSIARIAHPLITLENNQDIFARIVAIVQQEGVGQLVVGLPRNLSGQDTPQTAAVQDFVVQLKKIINIPVTFQDEALTSVQAERELKQRGGQFSKGDIDALAATYILEDYLRDRKGI